MRIIRNAGRGLSRGFVYAAVVFAPVLLSPCTLASQQPKPIYDPALYSAMEWRNIGPFRGGRAVVVAGIPAQPHTYYFGSGGGGVWKTEDAGITWKNVSDGQFKTASVGALAVAESDPNVVYAGMGEHAVRGVMTSHGDGVYKSQDGGKSWSHLGLDRTRQISAVRVHPSNPDLVYVAAQGSPYGDNPERGIFRSRDGGKTWDKILYVDQSTGASDLSMDMTNPRILYAAFWDHRRFPWAVRSGGPGSGLYKSVDGGDTWSRINSGLPELMGKTAVSVSRANPNRVWALVEAEEGGLFRSDNGGTSWERVNKERVLRARAWYYTKVFADPQDENLVYVLNAPVMKSTDGGRTFTNIPVPHGDNHGLWINPLNNQYIINSNDGGANVSLNGGRSWSTQSNQPTAQFYRVDTDNRFPYYIYGGQQDNSTVAIASRTADDGIDWKDWYAVSGCESAHLGFNPDDPTLVYGGCYQGQIEEYDHRTNQTRNVMAYPFQGLGSTPSDLRYRFNWNAPIEVSRHNPQVIYHAGNVLLRSEDRGRSWTAISPDLTRNEPEKQGVGGYPITNEAAGGEVYNTIFYIAESPHRQGTIWAGTDDGLVHLTRDGGANWSNVTPKGIGEAQINAIELSPHDPATAYIAVTRYKFNDFTPHIFKTSDYGRSWRRIVSGIPAEEWVRVVREDPVRRGLLYAGTEKGVYVSFNDGAQWQPLQLNLPLVPVTDLKIQNNDLVASTSGRAFWILDDLGPLQQMDQRAANAPAFLFRPHRAYRMEGGVSSAPGVGKNPPNGALIRYHLKEVPAGAVTLEIVDSTGTTIRRFTSEPGDTIKTPAGSYVPKQLPKKAGMNRFVWDLRHEDYARVPGVFVLGALEGRRVVPGTYQVRLSVDGQTVTQPVEVVPDPRMQAPPEHYRVQEALLIAIGDAVNEVHSSVRQMRAVREQIRELVERTKDHPQAELVRTAGMALVDKIGTWEDELVQPRQETFQDVINFPNRLNAELLYLKEAVDSAEPYPSAGARQRLADLMTEWQQHKTMLNNSIQQDVAAFNALFRDNAIPAVIIPF
jgi:photosystem II stability/assembly factor-like uncharacterized protein